jgi:hypothetical protein
MPAPLLSMYNGGRGRRAFPRFSSDRAATFEPARASRSSD